MRSGSKLLQGILHYDYRIRRQISVFEVGYLGRPSLFFPLLKNTISLSYSPDYFVSCSSFWDMVLIEEEQLVVIANLKAMNEKPATRTVAAF